MRTTSLVLALCLALASACDDTSSTSDGTVQVDTVPDAGTPDATGPLANVYKINPVEDKKVTSQVMLQHLTDPQGALSGKYADVWNCLNEPGGDKFNANLGGLQLAGQVCHLVQKAKPGSDGTYLEIKPPASDGDGNDSFAEVMAYHHVNAIHDHYYETFGLAHLKDKRMRTVVNAQVQLFGQWIGMLNAAYFPKETGSIFKQYFGVDLNNGEDAILFSQDTITTQVDPVYDAPVLYHEYTHATFGASVLWQPATDKYGLDPTPRALNEALADYLPSSFTNSPVMGTYSLAAVNAERDLRRVFKCPDHIVGEEHHDGEVASGTLWAMRQIVGQKVADQAIWNAVLTFGMSTNYEEAAQAFLDEVKQLAPDKESAVKQLFEDRGMIGCVRLKDHQDFEGATTGAPGYPAAMPTTFPDGTPSYIQYLVTLGDTTKEVTIEYVPDSGSIMGMPTGGAKGDVWVALRKASDPITYDYSGAATTSTAHAVLKGADEGTGYKLVLSGDCISKGDLVFLFLNKGAEGTLSKVKVTQSDTITNTTDNFSGCP